MKAGDYFVGSSLRQRLANVRGKVSTQFMSEGLQGENPSKRKVEESVRMEGYEVNFRKAKPTRPEKQQPMAGYSEFWIG